MLPVHLPARFVAKSYFFDVSLIVNIMYVIQLAEPQITCPLQSLRVTTNALFSNASGSWPMMSSVYFADKETSVVTNVTSIPAGEKFYSNFTIMSQDGDIVDSQSTHFSKCTFH